MNTWTFLFDLTWKSTAVLTLAFVVATALGRRSAASRHIVWTAAFATLLALPLLSISLPSWTHPLANAILPDSGVTFQTNATAGGAQTASRVAPGTAPVAHSAPAGIDPRRAAALLWTAGAMLAFLHLLLAHISAWRLRRISVPSRYTGAEFGIDEPVALREIADGMPMTTGILRPAIFLPAESADWTWERLRIVVAHEYAHIRRGDAGAQLLARTALCLQWFNPLAWFAWRALLAERERAADDLVLAGGAQPSDYAGHLLEIARTLQAAPAGASAGIAMARRSQLEGRLVAILDSRVKRGNPGRAALAVTLLAALALAAPLATVRAQSQAEQELPANIDLVIATANARKNHEMLEQTAVAFEKVRKFDEAQKLREAALALRKEAGAAQYAEGLVRLADLAKKRNATDAMVNFSVQAIQVGDMPETVPALLNLALESAFRGKDTAHALEYLQRARNVARTGNDTGRVLTWIAFLQESDPARVAETESMYRAALSMENPGSAEQAFTSELLARLLRNQDRIGEADLLQMEAAVMRRALIANLTPAFTASAVSSPFRVGGGVTAPKLLFKREPEYTEEARATRTMGTVLLKVVIDVDGIAKDIQVVKGVGLGLDEKAVEAAAAWRFKPGENGGGPVPVQAQIEINFRLM
jgi:TonB family protein